MQIAAGSWVDSGRSLKTPPAPVTCRPLFVSSEKAEPALGQPLYFASKELKERQINRLIQATYVSEVCGNISYFEIVRRCPPAQLLSPSLLLVLPWSSNQPTAVAFACTLLLGRCREHSCRGDAVRRCSKITHRLPQYCTDSVGKLECGRVSSGCTVLASVLLVLLSIPAAYARHTKSATHAVAATAARHASCHASTFARAKNRHPSHPWHREPTSRSSPKGRNTVPKTIIDTPETK